MYPSRAVLQWHLATGRPYVISTHGMLSPVALQYSRSKKWLAKKLYQVECFRRASCVLSTSEQERSDVKVSGFQTANTVVIPNGVPAVDLPFVKELNCKKRKILSLGRIHPIKGLGRLIKVWANISPDFPDWSLDIVGPDEDGYGRDLRLLAQSIGVERLQFFGEVTGMQKYQAFRESDLFVLPSLSENFALTVAESLMSETPVIANKGSPWSGLEEHACGWWIEPDSSSLERTLRIAMTRTPKELYSMGKAGREWMLRDYSWPSIAEHMVQLYQDTIDTNALLFHR